MIVSNLQKFMVDANIGDVFLLIYKHKNAEFEIIKVDENTAYSKSLTDDKETEDPIENWDDYQTYEVFSLKEEIFDVDMKNLLEDKNV